MQTTPTWGPGSELLPMHVDDVKVRVLDVKEHVCKHYGWPLFCQRLCRDETCIDDDVSVDLPADIQVVVLSLVDMLQCAEAADLGRDDYVRALVAASGGGHLDVGSVVAEYGQDLLQTEVYTETTPM